MIYKTVKTNGLSLQLKPLPPKPQPPSPPTFLKSMQSSVSLPSANILSLGISHQCTFLHYNQHNISQVSYISSDSGHPDFKCLREMNPLQSKICHPALVRSGTSHPLSKICHPPAVIDFFGAKNARAALISPSKRQKRHRGPDRTKIRQS